MATYNSALYAQTIGQPSTATGLAAPVPTFSDGFRNGGHSRTLLVSFDTALQNLASGSVVNVAILPAGSIITEATVISDTSTSSLTIQLGVTGTAGYYSTSAVATATAGKYDLFTNTANVNAATTAPTTLIATTGGAASNTGKLYFLIKYLSN